MDGDVDLIQDVDLSLNDEDISFSRPRTRRAIGIVSDSPPLTADADGLSDSLAQRLHFKPR